MRDCCRVTQCSESSLHLWMASESSAKVDAPVAVPSTCDDLLRGFGLRPAWRDLDAMSEIRNEVIEDDRSCKLKADLPGMKKQDIVSKSRF